MLELVKTGIAVLAIVVIPSAVLLGFMLWTRSAYNHDRRRTWASTAIATQLAAYHATQEHIIDSHMDTTMHAIPRQHIAEQETWQLAAVKPTRGRKKKTEATG